jgi:hypothetical protein
VFGAGLVRYGPPGSPLVEESGQGRGQGRRDAVVHRLERVEAPPGREPEQLARSSGTPERA